MSKTDSSKQHRRYSSASVLRDVRPRQSFFPLMNRLHNRESRLIFADFNDYGDSLPDFTKEPQYRKYQEQLESETRRHNDEAKLQGLSKYYKSSLADSKSRPSSSVASTVDGEKQDSIDIDKKLRRQTLPEPPYHIFTLRKKKQLVYIVSMAGLFSPLSSNIYFPALGAIATQLHVSISLVTLTITSYMVIQGIAPSFWGSFADTVGRRPIFIGTFVVYLIANLGLGLSRSFAVLMFFRALQAAGSSATISIGAGVIGDITTPAERGGLIGIFGGIRMLGQSIGPVLGGILTQFFGFRSIFYFLFILGGLVLLFIVFFLPETLRVIAGNGTVRLQGIQRPLIHNFTKEPEYTTEPDPNRVREKISFMTVVEPLKFLFEKDVFVSLFFGGIVYTVWSMVTASTTSLFQERYHLNSLLTGLAFLPNGAGCVLGSYITGMIMDRDYKIVEKQYKKAQNIPEETKLNRKTLEDFPVERARLRNIWWMITIFIVTTTMYGFSLKLNIAVPLILQFFIAYTATAIFNLNSALIIDLYPGKSASATAVNNLMRCSIGAVGVATIETLLAAVGPAVAFAGLAGLTLLSSPLVLVEWMYGMKWRMARTRRLKEREEKKKAEQKRREIEGA